MEYIVNALALGSSLRRTNMKHDQQLFVAPSLWALKIGGDGDGDDDAE